MNFKIDSTEAATLCADRLIAKGSHLRHLHLERMFNKQKYMDIALAGLASKPNQLEHVYIGDNSFEAKRTLEMAERFLQREMFPKLR